MARGEAAFISLATGCSPRFAGKVDVVPSSRELPGMRQTAISNRLPKFVAYAGSAWDEKRRGEGRRGKQALSSIARVLRIEF
jgi:hypothetical protein